MNLCWGDTEGVTKIEEQGWWGGCALYAMVPSTTHSQHLCLMLQLMEIKRLNASMATIRSQLNKYEEQVDECRRYQKFLDSVTPVEWQEQQKQARLARQQQRHATWLLQCEALKKQKQDAKGEVSIYDGGVRPQGFRQRALHQCIRLHPLLAFSRYAAMWTGKGLCSTSLERHCRCLADDLL